MRCLDEADQPALSHTPTLERGKKHTRWLSLQAPLSSLREQSPCSGVILHRHRTSNTQTSDDVCATLSMVRTRIRRWVAVYCSPWSDSSTPWIKIRSGLWASRNFRPHVSKHMGSISHKLMACLICLWELMPSREESSLPAYRHTIVRIRNSKTGNPLAYVQLIKRMVRRRVAAMWALLRW